MPKLRDVAAAFVNQGRALGEAEAKAAEAKRWRTYCLQLELALARIPNDQTRWSWVFSNRSAYELAKQVVETATKASEHHVKRAETAQHAAERLLDELEHRGEKLARRISSAVRGARAGWRTNGFPR